MAIDFCVIGERLKANRIKRGITQEALAEKLGVSVAFLSRIERGSSHINLTRLSQICEILDITEGEILNGVSTKSKNYLTTDFSSLLKDCPPEKLRLIYKIAKTIVEDEEGQI